MTDLLREFSDRYVKKGKLFEVHLELTHRCNLHCKHCYVDHEQLPHTQPVEQWKSAIDQLVEMGICAITFSGGEPLLYEGIFELILHAFRKGCQVRLFSNATHIHTIEVAEKLKASGLCYLETSLYGADIEIHDSITTVPGSFQKTLQAIHWLNALCIPITVKTSWIKPNRNEYSRMRELSDNLGVSFRASPVISSRINLKNGPQGYRMNFAELVDFHKIAYRSEDGTGASKGPVIGKPLCGIGRYSLTVAPDGTIYPCVSLRSALGNIFMDDIDHIWQSSPLLNQYRLITFDEFTECQACNFKDYCFICMGDNWLESMNIFKPSSETCMLACARKAARDLIYG
jgi:radical SAM protein with 4Fe4S-binding SPASM domain